MLSRKNCLAHCLASCLSGAKPTSLGEFASEVLFRLPLAKIGSVKPDLAFVSYQRWPKGQERPEGDNAWDVAHTW